MVKDGTWESLKEKFPRVIKNLDESVQVFLSNEILDSENWILLKGILGVEDDVESVTLEVKKFVYKTKKTRRANPC